MFASSHWEVLRKFNVLAAFEIMHQPEIKFFWGDGAQNKASVTM